MNNIESAGNDIGNKMTRIKCLLLWGWIFTALSVSACRGIETSSDIEGEAAADAAPKLQPDEICVTTQFTANQKSFADLAVQNHIAYTSKYGYRHQYLVGTFPGNPFTDPNASTPLRKFGYYWQKVTAVKNSLADPSCKWVMWIDADAVFTNFSKKIESVIETFGYRRVNGSVVEKNLILPRDESDSSKTVVVVNNGVFLVRNVPWSHQFFDGVEKLYPIYKDAPLPEQDAFQDVAFQVARQTSKDHRGPDDYKVENILPEVAWIPQRVMDSFYRPGAKDPARSSWKKCDFIAHISGTPDEERIQVLERLQEWMERDSCE